MLLSVCQSLLPAFPFLHRQISVLSRTDARTLWTKWIKGQSSSYSRFRFSQSAVFTVATQSWSTLPETWTTEVMRIYSSLSNIPLSFKVRRIIPLDRYLDIFLVLYNWCYIRKIHDRIKALCIYWFLSLVTSFLNLFT